MSTRSRGDEGQTTVELALALPVVAVVALGLLQVGLVVRDQILVTHAAREAVRAAAVSDDPAAPQAAAERGATGLDPARLRVAVVQREEPGGWVEVRVTYRAATELPLVGPLVGDADLQASAVMRVEG